MTKYRKEKPSLLHEKQFFTDPPHPSISTGTRFNDTYFLYLKIKNESI